MQKVPALQAENLSRNFGGLMAIHKVSITVESGERHAIIGPNGAGKTTLFNLLSGTLKPLHGHIFLYGQDITSLQIHERARLGIGRTFQRNSLFPNLTTFENVRLAVQARAGIGHRLFVPINRMTSLGQETETILERFELQDLATTPVHDLSYGVQRQLEVVLAMAIAPKILLLDEPTAGVSPAETRTMVKLLQSMPKDITLVIIEHDMDVVFELADRITVLHYGETIAAGPPKEVQADPRVREIYLGLDQGFHV